MAKRGRKPKERKGYFFEREEQAIVDYTQSENEEEKNQIFNTILLPALTKMIESIIRRYKLFVPDELFPQTFNDTISYLLTKINNFKPEMYVYEEIPMDAYISEEPVIVEIPGFIELKKNIGEESPKYVRVFSGSTLSEDEEEIPVVKQFKLELKHYKAYSYCGTVCKNYLIYKNMQYTKNRQRNQSYDEMVEEFTNDPDYVTQEEENPLGLVERLIKDMSSEIKSMIAEPEKNSLSENEIKVGIALTELLDNWEEVLNVDGSNKLQKSSVLYFLREETMMTTKEVRENMKSYKKAYYILKKGLIEGD